MKGAAEAGLSPSIDDLPDVPIPSIVPVLNRGIRGPGLTGVPGNRQDVKGMLLSPKDDPAGGSAGLHSVHEDDAKAAEMLRSGGL